MTTSAPGSRSPGRPSWLLLAAVLVVVVIGAWIAVQSGSRSHRQAALHRIEVANEALLPGDLELPPDRRGQDPTEWLARVATVQDHWDMAAISDPSTYRKLIETGRGGKSGEDARVAFERFEACIVPWLESQGDPEQAWNLYWIEIAARLQEADGTAEWKECSQAVVQLLAAGLEPSMRLAREAARYGAIDPQRVAQQLEENGGSFPSLPLGKELRLADAVQVTALFDVHAGRHRAALDDVRAGLAVARIHQPPQWLISWMLWALHVGRSLETLQMILPELPRGLDVTDIEAELTAMSPRDELAGALKGERAFVNRVFESLRDGSIAAGDEPFASSSILWRMRGWLTGDSDQAAYLDAMTEQVAITSRMAFARPELPEQEKAGFWTPVTAIVLPKIDGPLATADALEARLALARVALVAYRAGAKDALAFLSNSADPYDGKPLRAAWAKDDLVVFWSVGPDKKDDSARSGSDDIVWPLRLAD